MVTSDWETIVRLNYDSVVSAALRVLGCPADAEDVAQETLPETMRKREQREDNNWRGLLCRMAVCRALDLLRTHRHHLGFDFAAEDKRAANPLDSLIQQEAMQRLRAAVAELPEREAEVCCLACF